MTTIWPGDWPGDWPRAAIELIEELEEECIAARTKATLHKAGFKEMNRQNADLLARLRTVEGERDGANGDAKEERERRDEATRAFVGVRDARDVAQAENARLRDAMARTYDEICQVLGKALGYPWFKDDQKNFPGATEAAGVCVGEHVAESIAAEGARTIQALQAEVARLRAVLMEIGHHANANQLSRVLAALTTAFDPHRSWSPPVGPPPVGT